VQNVEFCIYRLQIPDTCEEWKTVAEGFYARWNFPNCIGSIDGKLVRLQRPVRAGGSYFNYKKYFSVNMMAVVESYGRFLYVTVGAQGSANDAAVYNASSFAELIADSSNPLNIPPTAELPDTNTATPMVFVADEAYPLRPYIMKPFSSRGLSASERIFNYRLSRARRTVENAFGMLANRFRIFHQTIQMHPEKVNIVVMASCVLHNMLRTKTISAQALRPHLSTSGPMLDDIRHLPRHSGAHYNAVSKSVRDKFSVYFVTSGQVPWQWKHANIAISRYEEPDTDADSGEET